MSGTLARLGPGDPLPTGRADWELFRLAAIDAARDQGGPGAADPLPTNARPQLEIWVRNDLGAFLPAFSVVGLVGPAVSPGTAPHEARRLPAFGTSSPTSNGAFGILSEPCGPGCWARAVVLGATPAVVQFDATTDTFANPAGGTPAYLASGTSGPAQILWPLSPTPAAIAAGPLWAMVLLTGSAGGGSGAALAVETDNASTVVSPTTTLQFDHAAFTVSEPAAGTALVGLLSAAPTGTPNTAAGYNGSGTLTSFPQYLTTSGAVTTYQLLPTVGANTPTSPFIQFQLDTSGTGTIKQYQLVAGTGSTNGVYRTLTVSQVQDTYGVGGYQGSLTVTQTGGVLQFALANAVLVGYATQTYVAGQLASYLLSSVAASTYIPQSQLGANSGVAQLNSSGYLTTSQIPPSLATQSYVSSALVPYLTSAAAASTYVAQSQLGAVGGVATLASSGYLTTSQIPPSLATQSYVSSALVPYLTSAAAASTYVAQSQLGAASGVPTLDSTARLTTSQLPTTASAYPTLNQNTTGSAARWATARTVSLTGDVSYTSGSLDGSANVTGAATVVALQGNAVGNAAPADGNVLTWVAADARWEPKAGPPVPPGTIAMYAGSAAPSGWLLCDGSSYSTTTYANLYGAIGTTYGSGSGTFKVPNMQCRFPLGAGSSTGLTTRTLGATGGEEAHTLTTAELPAHTHTQTQVWYTSGSFSTVAVGGPYPLDAGPRDTQSTGGGAAHNTVPPFLVLSFIIKT